jgi:hypothetical protein
MRSAHFDAAEARPDPAQAADVESVAGACDSDVGEAGFGVVDVSRQGVTVRVCLFLVHGFGEVLADAEAHSRPLALWAVETTISAPVRPGVCPPRRG